MAVVTEGEAAVDARFPWVPFYEAVARALLAYRSDRAPLLAAVLNLGAPDAKPDYLTRDQFADGRVGPIEDIDPFTTLAVFNRSAGADKRTRIAGELARFLRVGVPPPTGFHGIPTVDPRSSWYFPFAKDRGAGDIDALWRIFAAAARLADSDGAAERDEFAAAHDAAMMVSGVKWNLSFGLFWSHPQRFLPMSAKARPFIESILGESLRAQPPDGRGYLALVDELRGRFERADARVHSFPELALAAWLDNGASQAVPAVTAPPPPAPAPTAAPYAIDDIVREGCFLAKTEIETALGLLRERKNLILQGPPGTGKTWLARRLAYACVTAKDPGRVEAIQFHANSSYEDLVCGYRPDCNGHLTIADGAILQAIQTAQATPERPYVLVIEEFNRGNPAHILGELLTLLEPGQRGAEHALRLAYPDADGHPRRVSVPPNFYVIGTMNVADRSLAALDHALRRRFAFVPLRPAFNDRWVTWLAAHGVPAEYAEGVRSHVAALNQRIAGDVQRLGPQYAIGHSYFTPGEHESVANPTDWFRTRITNEIGPLLDEYWFDEPAAAKAAREELLKGWPPA